MSIKKTVLNKADHAILRCINTLLDSVDTTIRVYYVRKCKTCLSCRLIDDITKRLTVIRKDIVFIADYHKGMHPKENLYNVK